jgi:hypothetical protein
LYSFLSGLQAKKAAVAGKATAAPFRLREACYCDSRFGLRRRSAFEYCHAMTSGKTAAPHK